jgi:hypothetical protein
MPVGIFAFTLYSDSTLDTLTYPTVQTIEDIGDLTAQLDREPGKMELDSLSLKLMDDYSLGYTEGFWFKVINAPVLPRLKITLDEGAGPTHYYYGELDPLSVVWTEHYVSTTFIRTPEFDLLSMVKALNDVDSSDWITKAFAQKQATGLEFAGLVHDVLKLTEFFAALMETEVGGNFVLNSDFSSTDAVFVWDGVTSDLVFYSGATPHTIADLYLDVTNDMGEDPTHNIVTQAYWLSSADQYLPKLYPKAIDLLFVLCKNFCVFPVMTYAGGRFVLELRQKGHTYDGTLALAGELMESKIVTDFDVRLNAVRCFRQLDETDYYWIDRDGSTGPSGVRANVNFDSDISALFVLDGANYEGVYYYADGVIYAIDGMAFWDYEVVKDLVDCTSAALLEEAVARYEYGRLSGRRKTMERTYSSIQADAGAGNTHTAVKLLSRLSIDDGTGADVYYINKFVKKPMESRVELQLVQE